MGRAQVSKGPATRNDIVDDIVDDPSSTMVFNVAKIASARASSTISLTKSLRVAGPLIQRSWVQSHRRRFESWASSFTPRCLRLSLNECVYEDLHGKK